jgi:histidine triad (HIT) family protein
MLDSSCLFCKIIRSEIPAEIIQENDQVLVIKDKFPKAPIHYLIIPKKHIVSMHEITAEDQTATWAMITMIRDIAQTLPGAKGFNILSNNGRDAGQTIFHMHWHLVSGRNLGGGDF